MIPTLFYIRYLKGLCWQSESSRVSTWESIISGLGRAVTSDNERSDNCVGDKWTRVRHRGTWACGEGADGSHLASSLPPGTDPLSKNEKISPIPCPWIILTYFHNNTHRGESDCNMGMDGGVTRYSPTQLDKNNLILKHQFVMLNKINIMFYELEIDFWWWSIFLVYNQDNFRTTNKIMS